jgi:hypothetical protein
MLPKERYLQLHSRFYDLLNEESVWFGKLLPDGDYQIASTAAQGGGWMMFHMLAEGQTNELLNGINHFCSRARRLSVWAKILEETQDENEKFSAVLEMVEPVFRITMDYPYAFKSSLIFSSVLLLRDTADLLKFSFKEFKDRDITHKTLEAFQPLAAAQGWGSFDVYLQKLSDINSKAFVEQTQNYRNRFHHQIEPHLEVGLLSSVVRKKEEKGLAYEFGVEHPVKLSAVLPLLASEHAACVEAFKAFWSLLVDQVNVWKLKYPFEGRSTTG